VRLPGTVSTPRLALRRWQVGDVAVLSSVILTTLDHLRPWMSWAAAEPLSAEARAEVLRAFERSWESGAEVVFGAFLHDDVAPGAVAVGGCGLVGRAERSALEIGYWVHVDHLRLGYATEMASALTDAAFGVGGVERVEIHHDRANLKSRAVPARLGFTFEGEHPDDPVAPAEEGIDCTWVMLRPDWVSRQDRRR